MEIEDLESTEQDGTNQSTADDNTDLQGNPSKDGVVGQAGASLDDAEDDVGKEADSLDKDVYGAPESYDYTEVQIPEGMELDKEMMTKFDPIAKKFNLNQKSTNELLGLAVELVQKQTGSLIGNIKEARQAEIAQYEQLLEADKEIGENKEVRNAYLDIADIGYNAIANSNVKSVLAQKGLDYHPDIVKMFHKIGQYCKDDVLPSGGLPIGKNEDPATVLYGE